MGTLLLDLRVALTTRIGLGGGEWVGRLQSARHPSAFDGTARSSLMLNTRNVRYRGLEYGVGMVWVWYGHAYLVKSPLPPPAALFSKFAVCLAGMGKGPGNWTSLGFASYGKKGGGQDFNNISNYY